MLFSLPQNCHSFKYFPFSDVKQDCNFSWDRKIKNLKKEQPPIHVQGLFLSFLKVTDPINHCVTGNFVWVSTHLSAASFIFSLLQLLIASTPNETFQNMFPPSYPTRNHPRTQEKFLVTAFVQPVCTFEGCDNGCRGNPENTNISGYS